MSQTRTPLPFIKVKGTYIYNDSLNWYLTKCSKNDQTTFKVNRKEMNLKCFGTPPTPYLLLDNNSIENVDNETLKMLILETLLDSDSPTHKWIPIRIHPLCYNKEITIDVDQK